MGKTYDFSGWATKNDLLCTDGRTIRRDAFKDCDGMTVPLVWMHDHMNPENVLGHALLENMEEGVRAYGSFNDTELGQIAKKQVEHGDITHLSIWANQLKQNGGDVLHGMIREVSLVLAGANPGAFIDFPIVAHGEESETDAVIYTGEDIELYHAEAKDEEEKKDESAPDKKEVEEKESSDKKEKEKEEMAEEKKERTVKDVYDEMTEEQKKVVAYLVGEAIADEDEDEDEIDDEEMEEEEEDEVKHNVFDNNEVEQGGVLSHADMEQIFADAKKIGSLKDAYERFAEENNYLAHTVYDRNGEEVKYGIADIDYLFPDARTLQDRPEFIKRDDNWVRKVLDGAHHTPFSRIKSVFANITMDEARARGYVKGKLKKDEVFSLLKRATDPQTIYKKQKLDRDDVIDITDFDVVAWLRMEMRQMLDEEIARAALIGDGRLVSDDDHISEEHIRPIAKDADLYNIKVNIPLDSQNVAKDFIKKAIKARKDYKGSGNPTLFTTEDMLTDMLLLEDGFGHFLYANQAALATVLRVKEIVTVPVFEGVKLGGKDLLGVIVNMADYNFGADKGGAVSMFDDFDIDYNQMKYLIETRCSGALTKPYSAITITMGASGQTGETGETGTTGETGE